MLHSSTWCLLGIFNQAYSSLIGIVTNILFPNAVHLHILMINIIASVVTRLNLESIQELCCHSLPKIIHIFFPISK